LFRPIAHLYQYLWLAGIVAVAIWQFARPVHAITQPLFRRWCANLSLFAMSRVLSTLILSSGAVATAIAVARSPIGLLNRSVIPYGVRFVLAMLLLDLARYARHWVYHSTAIGWRIHQVHHSDTDYDLTTGLRFHPVEDVLTGVTDIAVVALLSPPALAVATGEAIAVVSNLVIHANASLPRWLDRVLRRFLVTPDVHRIHHSADSGDHGTNFGILFTLWDRLLGTFRARPAAGPANMRFGLSEMRGPEATSVPTLLALPFQGFPESRDQDEREVA
jgi:sterol desaturase/sphingolipid hydroxylase (fatty acid hydroxylase superfamily)